MSDYGIWYTIYLLFIKNYWNWKETHHEKTQKKTYLWQYGTHCQLVYSVLFSVLPAIQSFLAQLLGIAVVLRIIIGDFILTWASHEQNNRETCFIHLYKAIQVISGITSWLLMTEKNKQVSGWNKFWQLC